MNLAAANARCANTKPLASPIDKRMHGLKVDVPAALAYIVRVADAMSKLRTATADFTNSCHKRKHSARSTSERPKSHFSKAESRLATL